LFVQFNRRDLDVAHHAIMQALASLPDADAQIHHGIAMRVRQSFRCPDAASLAQRADNAGLPFKRKRVHRGSLLWPTANVLRFDLSALREAIRVGLRPRL
jgi:hypothetical protein